MYRGFLSQQIPDSNSQIGEFAILNWTAPMALGPFGQHFPVNAKAHAVDFDCGPLRVDLEIALDLYVYMYIYYMYIYIYMYGIIYIYKLFTFTYIYIYVYGIIYIYTNYSHLHIYIYTHSIYIYISIYLYTFIFMCTHINIDMHVYFCYEYVDVHGPVPRPMLALSRMPSPLRRLAC